MPADNSETLDLRKLRAHRHADEAGHDYAHEPGPAYNPHKAAEARARIAGLPEHPTLTHPDAIPAAPTRDLITDKERLVAAGHKPAAPKRMVPSALGPVLAAVGNFLIVLLLFKAPIL